jgi:hypothetical protein
MRSSFAVPNGPSTRPRVAASASSMWRRMMTSSGSIVAGATGSAGCGV